jgi:putative phosphoesterase
MRVAVISDMHGNAVAFDAVLADITAQGVERIVCLGDAVQGGPQPAEVVTRLRALGCPVVMGNADDFLLHGRASDAEPVTDQQRAVREWSLAQLSEADRAFIRQFQPTVEVALDDRILLCFHGSPVSFDDIIFPETPEDEFRRLLGPYVPALMCGGHTHLQQLRRLDETLFFNPGSVGRALDRTQAHDPTRMDPWAEYALVQSVAGRLTIAFQRVPFDVDELIRITLASGTPYATDALTQYGRAG